MPELPEVETVARQLQKTLPGSSIRGLRVLDDKLGHLGQYDHILAQATVVKVFRSGKQVVFELNTGNLKQAWLLVHLRMTGRLYHQQPVPTEPVSHLRVRFLLDKDCLDFVDTRRFGTVEVTRKREDIQAPGLDPFARTCTAERLLRLAGKSKSPIKAFLLRQDRITGLGNIYVCEILHACGLSPWKAANELSGSDWKFLIKEMRRILLLAIDLCGTTFRDFQDSQGTEGQFGSMLKVYNRSGQDCLNCDGTVIREVIGQRGTFWCPDCQKG